MAWKKTPLGNSLTRNLKLACIPLSGFDTSQECARMWWLDRALSAASAQDTFLESFSHWHLASLPPTHTSKISQMESPLLAAPLKACAAP